MIIITLTHVTHFANYVTLYMAYYNVTYRIFSKWILVRQPDTLFVDIGPATEYTRRMGYAIKYS